MSLRTDYEGPLTVDPRYSRLHYELKRDRGLASQHPCAEGCGRQAADWANVSGEYLGIEDFRPLCRPCHVSQDARRAHDAREDHVWEESPLARYRQRCATCRRRSSARRHAERMATDPEYAERWRERNRRAVARYKAKQVAAR